MQTTGRAKPWRRPFGPLSWTWSGFSLVETLVVLALVAVLLGLAAPGVATWRARHGLQAVAEDLWNGLVLARSQALVQQQRVVLCPLSASGECDAQGSWSSGWQVFVDGNHNRQRDSGERVLLTRGALPAGVRLVGNSTVRLVVKYGADGRSDSLSGTFTLCRLDSPEGWQVVVNALGRARMAQVGSPECP